MKALHKLSFDPSKNSCPAQGMTNTAQGVEASIEKLKAYLQTIEASQTDRTFEAHEAVIKKLIHELGREALGQCLAYYDVSSDFVTVETQTYKKIMRSKKIYQTCMGPIALERHLYANRKKAGDGKSICPLELQAGIIEGYWTPGAAKNALWSLSHLTPSETESLLLQFGGMDPSRSSLDRLPKLLNDHFEPQTIEQHEAIIQEEAIPAQAVSVSISLDGVMIAMKSETSKKTDKKGQCEWKEASCGTLSYYDKDGERLSTCQYGRMPEHKKVTLKTLLRNHAEAIHHQRPDLKLVQIADGAQDNWTFFDEEMPLGFQITDFYHACEHLKEAIDASFKPNKLKAKEQFEKYKIVLRDDEKGVEKIIRALRYLRDKFKENAIIRCALTYFVNNRHRMKYALAKQLNYPIGSGVVEAACKTLVGQRLKRSGMSWCQHGGQGILTFRALIKSHRFDQAWQFVAGRYKKTVQVHANVIAFSGNIVC